MRKNLSGRWEKLADSDADQHRPLENQWQFMAWLETFPADVRDIVVDSPFDPFRFLPVLCASGTAGLDLYRTGGSFWIFAIAHSDELGTPVGSSEYSGLVLAKRTRIAERLGFPPTKQMAKIAAKIVIQTFPGPWFLPQARSVLRNPASLALLSHVETVSYSSLHVLGCGIPQHYLTSTLLDEIARDHESGYASNRLLLLYQTWSRVLPETPFPVIRSMHQAETLAQRVGVSAIDDNREFPESPISVPQGISYLDCANALRREGHHRKNCVAMYVEEAVFGQSYFFSLRQPEPATLRIAKDRGTNCWKIVEIKAPCNQPVKPETVEYVTTWLDEASREITSGQSGNSSGTFRSHTS
ncbi:MAG: PcfJ domain-containing protein [Deltaproteobacteria bacterium]|nr:PcfJ domain-containing protein [Deltaproteobacteria bacterium]